MILPSGHVDKDVIEINEEDTFVDKGGEDGFCHALECVASMRQAKYPKAKSREVK